MKIGQGQKETVERLEKEKWERRRQTVKRTKRNEKRENCFRFAHSAEATYAQACLRRKGCFCFRQRCWMGNDDDELCQPCDINLIEIIYCFLSQTQ